MSVVTTISERIDSGSSRVTGTPSVAGTYAIDDGASSTVGGETSSLQGPGHVYDRFVQMEGLFDKLKLLNFQTEFSTEMKMKPISRHYFAISTNSGEQFYIFCSVAAWLIRKCGRSMQQPQEFDDPNSTIAEILDNLRQIGGSSVDFAPNKLKQGSGENVIAVLFKLADAALEKSGFEWKTPIPPRDLGDDDVEQTEESELTLERAEEEIIAMIYSDNEDDDDDDDEGRMLMLDDLRGAAKVFEVKRPEKILESNANTEEWMLELERVIPQLKVIIKTDPRNWRTHIEQLQTQQKAVTEAMETTHAQLDRLYTDLGQAMTKVTNREKYLNTHLETQLQQFRAMQDQLTQIKAQYREVATNLTQKTQRLNMLSEELDGAKREMEERGSSMTDGTPLVNLRKAISTLRGELSTIDIQMGVLTHTLLQAKMKDKTAAQMQLHSSSYNSASLSSPHSGL